MVDAQVPELAPRAFRRALTSVREALVHPAVEVAALTAPSRMAPWASALAGAVAAGAPPGPGDHAARPSDAESTPDRAPGDHLDDDAASGRLVLLHDPGAPAAWGGTFRVVVYVRATLAADEAHDPMVADVARSWLVDALDAASARPSALGGTVTRVTSQPFGELADTGEDSRDVTAPVGAGVADVTAEVELRASWTPPADAVGASVTAWADVMATAAGLPPLPDGVARLPRRPR